MNRRNDNLKILYTHRIHRKEMKLNRVVRIGLMPHFNKGTEFGISKDTDNEEMTWKYVGVTKGS